MIISDEYRTDLGSKYQFLPISVSVQNRTMTEQQILDLLPSEIVTYYRIVADNFFTCPVAGIKRRNIEFTLDDGAIIKIDVPVPFTELDIYSIVNDAEINEVKLTGERLDNSLVKQIIEGGI